jgi:DNA (cytosine-5)-methyltransferase 1
MKAWYNEIDPYAAQWLRNLIRAKLISDGEVDERPIQDVKPADLKHFTRCHFFAGIAGWDLALQYANFPADREVWTGSCPCQPFSTAGKRLQFADERHLWPFWFHLISVCRPPTVFGEQVANGSGPWLDLVLADLESADYAVGAAVLPAAGVGAPHIRDRVWFVADASGAKRLEQRSQPCGLSSGFADGGTVSDPDSPRSSLRRESQLLGQCAPVVGSDWWSVEPDVGRVVDGFPTRAQRLRGYGNAIVPQVAATFIKAYLECRP